MGGAPKKPGGAWWQVVEDQLLAPLALGCFVGSILASTVLQILAIGLLILHPSSPLGWTLLALLVRVQRLQHIAVVLCFVPQLPLLLFPHVQLPLRLCCT